MQYKQRFPWFSLTLLVIAYGAFGWYLFGPESIQYSWIAAEILIVLLMLLLTVPIENTGLRFINWSASSGTTLILSMFLGFLSLSLLVLLRVAGYLIIVAASSALARLDLQTIGMRQLPVFLLLTTCAFAGLALGWLIHQWLDLFWAGSALGSALQPWVVP